MKKPGGRKSRDRVPLKGPCGIFGLWMLSSYNPILIPDSRTLFDHGFRFVKIFDKIDW
jgi:hypothetical protein